MIAKSVLALFVAGCSAPSARVSQASLASDGARSIFDVAATPGLALPATIPDDLLLVEDPLDPGHDVSLRAGVVVGAWTTVPDAMGNPPLLVYQCRPDPAQPGPADGGVNDFSRAYTWVVKPEAALAPIGVDPAALAATLPFTAVHEQVPRGGIYLVAPSGPAWTITGQIGEGAAATTARVQVVGDVNDLDPSPDLSAIPLYRYRKTGSSSSEVVPRPTIDRADYVLRVDTVGGLGPDDEGDPCDPGSLDVPSPFSADFYFVAMPWSYLP